MADVPVVPEEAKGLYDLVQEEVDKVISVYKDKKLDGLTFKEVFEVLTTAVSSFVRLVESVGGAHPGKWKKAVVVAAIESFYEQVIKPIDLPIPDWLEWTVVDPVLEKSIAPVISGLIDGLVTLFNSIGWSLEEGVTPDPV